jgi:hypothetical protein
MVENSLELWVGLLLLLDVLQDALDGVLPALLIVESVPLLQSEQILTIHIII